MKIVEITAQNDFGYKEFFTKGLSRHDACFRISPADEAKDPFPTKGTPDSFTLAALSETNTLMGVASFKRETDNREKLSHKGLLFRMYVAQEFSGQAIGGKLIEAIIARAKELGTIEQINLTVVAGNEKAQGLYTKHGFKVYGVETNSVKTGGRYFDENLMALFIH